MASISLLFRVMPDYVFYGGYCDIFSSFEVVSTLNGSFEKEEP
jgi:hypothetical protein